MAHSNDVLVVGGGLIGLAIAHRLASSGLGVTLFDRGDRGRASPAAGGLLSSPIHDRSTEPPFFDLCLASRRLYPDWIQEIRQAIQETSKLDPELLDWGSLEIFGGEAQRSEWLAKAPELRAKGVPVEILDEQQLRSLEPELGAVPWGGALLPDDHHVNNEELLRALGLACVARGVELKQGVAVHGLVAGKEEVLGVETSEGVYTGSHTVCASGAWTASLLQPLGISLPIRPIRGQILTLKGQRPLRHVLHGPKGYVVPRLNGELLVGSTLEDVGFQVANTAEAVGRFCEVAANFAPRLREAEILRIWSGLRPRMEDGKPALGLFSRFRRLVAAAGHYRDGILLAPLTAKIVADLVLHGASPVDLAPFSPDRFQA